MILAGKRPAWARGLKPSDFIATAVLLTITLAIPFIAYEQSRGAFPDGNIAGTMSFYTAFLVTVGVFALLTMGLNIQWGYTGVINFGVLAFFMLGAYTTAIITKGDPQGDFTTYIGGWGNDLNLIPALATDQWLPFVIATAAAALAAGLLALLVAFPTLHLREDYLAIATIGIAEVMRRVVIEERWMVNGSRGLTGVPQPLGGLVDQSDYKYLNVVIVGIVVIIVFFALERAVRSPWGRVLRGLSDDEEATAASGKNVFAFKTQSFVVGAAIMGIGGSMYAYAFSALSPDAFTHLFATFIFWAMLMVGGSGNNKGAIAGAYVIWGLWTISLQMQGYELGDVIESRMPFIRGLLLGVAIVGVLLIRPLGLLPQERRVSAWVERRVKKERSTPAPPAET
ncbi:MAG: branched-chain amino acid ABC transporter permease [Chloroflexi bacterium]|nr:branched-chain amino acid ABC transporter permease [Chloroflexota bacterium]